MALDLLFNLIESFLYGMISMRILEGGIAAHYRRGILLSLAILTEITILNMYLPYEGLFAVILILTIYLFLVSEAPLYRINILNYAICFNTVASIGIELAVLILKRSAGLSVEQIADSDHMLLLTFLLSRVIIALVLWLVAGYTGRHLYDAGKTGMAFTIAFTAMYFITIYFEGLILSESPDAELLTVINLVILVFVLFVYFVFLHLSRTIQIEKENALIDNNIKYYQQNMEEFRKKEEELRTIRHDMKGSLVLIQAEIDNGTPENASAYIQEKIGEINQTVLPVRSGNLLVDTVLSNFLIKAEEKEIHPMLVVTVGTLSPSLDRDLALILTNLTDNIIENTDREKKEVRLELTRSENQICLRMSNTTDNKEIRSRKADHENHGIGLKSVQRIVEQYHGTSDIYLQDGVCYQEYVLFI